MDKQDGRQHYSNTDAPIASSKAKNLLLMHAKVYHVLGWSMVRRSADYS